MTCLLCHRAVRARGVCEPHYISFSHRVKRGLTTWEALEAEGKTLPARPRGKARARPPMNPAERAFLNLYGKRPTEKEREQFGSFYQNLSAASPDVLLHDSTQAVG